MRRLAEEPNLTADGEQKPVPGRALIYRHDFLRTAINYAAANFRHAAKPPQRQTAAAAGYQMYIVLWEASPTFEMGSLACLNR